VRAQYVFRATFHALRDRRYGQLTVLTGLSRLDRLSNAWVIVSGAPWGHIVLFELFLQLLLLLPLSIEVFIRCFFLDATLCRVSKADRGPFSLEVVSYRVLKLLNNDLRHVLCECWSLLMRVVCTRAYTLAVASTR